MDLKAFYFNNIKESEYHYRFYQSIKNVNQIFNLFDGPQEANDYDFEIFDIEEAITKFKELCQPEITIYDNEKKCWFYLVTYYLYKMGFEIREFPRLLARPPVEPSDFTYGQIRNKIIAEGNDDSGTVRYATRRVYIANLSFDQKTDHIELEDAIEQKFTEISNRNASFDKMSTDEKLAEIANLIENLLKKNGKFITLEYSSICFDFISNSSVTSYRNKMQCFRHSTDESIIERSKFSEKQKSFLVDYGLTIVKAIHSLQI